MLNRILIANRGEIALRITRACRELGIETVAVYSEADRNALHLRYADETVCIGPAASTDSYLNVPALIAAAEIANADAIHPGYGFLAENAHFVEACQSCNINFIGPAAETIALVGDKVAAIELARSAKVPTVPGSGGPVETEQEASVVAQRIGLPVLIKAAAGGGGRGMRVVREAGELHKSFQAARVESEAAFKDPTVYIEKFVERPRHVEVQILADQHGNVIHLGERDCSLQRRHQKLLEESPCVVLSADNRRAMCEAAIRLAKAANYHSAGTVEFILDQEGNFYFIEINARIQVEHPVSEEVTGIDLIKQMIRIASGERLPVTQEEVQVRGHAIEFRINAEDPSRNFAPSPGVIDQLITPAGPGVRWDSHVYQGYRVPPYYDSMVGKLIVHRRTRQAAIHAARRALAEIHMNGVVTTVSLFQQILDHPDFMKGEVDTGFIERFFTPG
ncbi:MAG: acetyl-CoA carboxylase biotin carboxylase subunit [Planctomycetota bacterium]|jgi:acetyl-CoA carboxylase biotin carboxylase subunit